MTRASRPSVPARSCLLGACVAFASAACGGGEDAKAPSPSVRPSPTAPRSSAPTPPSSTAGTSATGSAPSVSTPREPMKPIAPSAMTDKLREIGVDPKALPLLSELDPKTLRDVMNTFTKALGVRCNYCHEKDFKAPTVNKTISTHMWNDFARAFTMSKDGDLYCDSCHAGRATFLDRTDPAALSAWMEENYVHALTRAFGGENSCATCHGDPFEGKILTKLWK